ncbi:MAG: hypothetical protein VXW87_02370 [Pseudomonadota bacterium]|nr:hypothetical protein [Pseudomonadota bacterium]
MANLKSLSLTASLALIAPFMIAGYHDSDDSALSGISLGFEVGANIHDVSWAATTSNSIIATAAASYAKAPIENSINSLLATSRFALTEGHDKSPYYAFTGAIFAKTTLTEDFSAMVRIGYDFSGTDGIAMKTIPGTSSSVPTSGHDKTGTMKLKNAFSPAVFVGYDSLYLGALYQMNEYEVTESAKVRGLKLTVNSGTGATTFGVASDTETTGTAISAGDIKENMMLFGFKALMPAQVDEFTVTLSAEAFTNFGAKADSDLETHYKNLVSQLPGSGIALDSNTYATTGKFLYRGDAYTTSEVHTNYYRLGLSVAMEFTTL